ncbi:zinc-ribbon domain-containing protein [Candidatus Pelagibacter sp. FZCC0015]|uniref:zinc-ribbon domain-containing protein n=1 Tax=Candidatus Pelagibacter sp. FZCC0015 TaxID=2268451 RepID=UPI0011A24703|nr:zinc-ribbon domain-containing protein [Candidatus Pelagibacter sp. FZCC0015]
MIITCPNCNKQFKIDNSLIPYDGRDLQCGSCDHVWFYKKEDKSEPPLTLNQNISENKVDKDIETKDKNFKFSKKLQQENIIKPEIKKEISKEIPETVRMSSNKGSKFFSYLVVFIISFVALIILLDTLKNPLINVFPGLEIILFNLYETLQDIKLFIIDLT